MSKLRLAFAAGATALAATLAAVLAGQQPAAAMECSAAGTRYPGTTAFACYPDFGYQFHCDKEYVDYSGTLVWAEVCYPQP